MLLFKFQLKNGQNFTDAIPEKFNLSEKSENIGVNSEYFEYFQTSGWMNVKIQYNCDFSAV